MVWLAALGIKEPVFLAKAKKCVLLVPVSHAEISHWDIFKGYSVTYLKSS